MKFKFIVRYEDGLEKKGKITEAQLDQDLPIWCDEMKNTDGDRLIFIQVTEIKK